MYAMFLRRIDGWMTQFYVLFNSISVISGRCLDDNERLLAINSVYGSKKISPRAGIELGPLDQ